MILIDEANIGFNEIVWIILCTACSAGIILFVVLGIMKLKDQKKEKEAEINNNISSNGQAEGLNASVESKNSAMSKRAKVSIAASLVCALSCVGVVLGTTTSFFTAETQSSVHIYAGNLDASLYLTSVSHFSYPGNVTADNQDQYPGLSIGDPIVIDTPYKDEALMSVIDSTDTSLYVSNIGESGINGIDFGTYTGSINIRNAFPSEIYTVKFILKNNGGVPFNFTVTPSFGECKKANGSTIDEDTVPTLIDATVGTLPTGYVVADGTSQEFAVNFEILDCDTTYMGSEFSVDIHVTCTQVINPSQD